VHWGIAGNANEDLQIGDVTIPQHWAHLSLWNWQRHGHGPANELQLEAAGDYTRQFGFLNFSNYTVVGHGSSATNTLNSIWYQPEEIFPASGTTAGAAPARILGPRQQALLRPRREARGPGAAGVPAPPAQGGAGAQGLQRQRVHRRRQLPAVPPGPFRVHPRGDGERRVALVAHQLGVPFLTIRSLSDLAGGGSSLSNEAATFLAIAAQNAVDVMLKFVPLLAAAGENARLLPEDV
jgi:hypothetical protein